MDGQQSFFDNLQPKTAFIFGIVLAVLGIGTLGFLMLGGCILKGDCPLPSASGDKLDAQAAPSPSVPTAAADVPAVTDEDWIRGDKNAALTVIEYSDFQCPFCSRFHPTMQQVMKEYAGKVRWVYRHFPLSFHPEAQPAAEAAECAGEQGKFWEYGDKLIENQATLGAALYAKLAAELGLNKGKFQDCVDGKKYTTKVQAQAQSGAAAGVNGTPGSFVIDRDGNVQEIQGALPYESVKAVIDSML